VFVNEVTSVEIDG